MSNIKYSQSIRELKAKYGSLAKAKKSDLVLTLEDEDERRSMQYEFIAKQIYTCYISLACVDEDCKDISYFSRLVAYCIRLKNDWDTESYLTQAMIDKIYNELKSEDSVYAEYDFDHLQLSTFLDVDFYIDKILSANIRDERFWAEFNNLNWRNLL